MIAATWKKEFLRASPQLEKTASCLNVIEAGPTERVIIIIAISAIPR